MRRSRSRWRLLPLPVCRPNQRPIPPSPSSCAIPPRDFSKPRGYWPNLVAPYSPTTVPPPNFLNSVQLDNLVKNGKIYLSLSDAVLLALQNNYDIAIQRLNLDIADTDLLRAQSGAGRHRRAFPPAWSPAPRAAPRRPSVLSAAVLAAALLPALPAPAPAASPSPPTAPVRRPRTSTPRCRAPSSSITQFSPQSSPIFSGGLPAITQNTNTYNFSLNKGFITGTNMQVAFDNTRTTTDNLFSFYSPALQSSFNFALTQHLLQGFGTGVNGRFIVQAKNDRRIADSVFRQQLLYTINQVENIYWGLVSAYEDVQSKQRALDQSTRLEKDDEKQLQIGSMAPLDVVNAKSQMSSDQQALIASQNTLEYQQLVMKQAIARNLDDPALANAPIIPTDRVSLAETPEEHMSVDDLVREADANRPDVEQAILNLRIDELTLKGVKNGLLPTLDVEAFYGASALGGAVSPNCPAALRGLWLSPCGLRPLGQYRLRHRAQQSLQQHRAQ